MSLRTRVAPPHVSEFRREHDTEPDLRLREAGPAVSRLAHLGSRHKTAAMYDRGSPLAEAEPAEKVVRPQAGQAMPNAFIERFNRTCREEVLDDFLWVSSQEV